MERLLSCRSQRPPALPPKESVIAIQSYWLAPVGLFLITSLALGATEKANKPPTKTYSIAGHVADLKVGFRATMKLSGNNKPNRTMTGQADGSFAFRNVPPGSYTVRPSNPKFTFSPSFHTVAVTDHDHEQVDFTAHYRDEKKKY